MDSTIQKLIDLNLDLELVGLIQSSYNEGYYCTPKGAEILGWAGVDGIHYCQIPGFGETVFVVDPTEFDSPVHPIARNTTDLLRLLLACGDMAAPAQAHAFPTEQRFKEFITECRPDNEKQEVFRKIERSFDIKPMPLPYKYLSELQAGFDLDSIPYTDEYYETIG